MNKVANRKLSRRMEFRGLQISIETDKGELRHWYDPHSKTEGTTKMKWPYGYIRRTEGTDGDHVDVYVGPNKRAHNVYVVNQMKAPNFDSFDEQKCMLGFNSAEAARKAYLDHYNNERFLGSMTAMPFEQFQKKVLATLHHPEKLAEVAAQLGSVAALQTLGLTDRQTHSTQTPTDLTKLSWGGTYFHGTTPAAEKSILQTGLDPRHGGISPEGANAGLRDLGIPGAQQMAQRDVGRVYLHRSRTLAKAIGMPKAFLDATANAAMDTGSVVRGLLGGAHGALEYQPLQVQGPIGRVYEDLLAAPGSSVYTRSHIPASQITKALPSRIGQRLLRLIPK